MKDKLTNEDVMEIRKLFWMKFRGEITLAEMQRRVDAISGKQLRICPLCPISPILQEAVK